MSEEIKKTASNAIESSNLLEVDLLSVDFETNEMIVILPPEIVARGFHAGKVKVDLSGVQRTSNVKREPELIVLQLHQRALST